MARTSRSYYERSGLNELLLMIYCTLFMGINYDFLATGMIDIHYTHYPNHKGIMKRANFYGALPCGTTAPWDCCILHTQNNKHYAIISDNNNSVYT
jgi:hypothetical protein